MVVVAQAYYHPWHAYVDGEPTRLWRANYAYQALEVPPGKHQVRLVYEDHMFWGGVLLSLAALLACSAAWVWWRNPLQNKKRNQSTGISHAMNCNGFAAGVINCNSDRAPVPACQPFAGGRRAQRVGHAAEVVAENGEFDGMREVTRTPDERCPRTAANTPRAPVPDTQYPKGIFRNAIKSARGTNRRRGTGWGGTGGDGGLFFFFPWGKGGGGENFGFPGEFFFAGLVK